MLYENFHLRMHKGTDLNTSLSMQVPVKRKINFSVNEILRLQHCKMSWEMFVNFQK